MRTSTFIITALGAAATGALLGVLFAPGKGSKTRDKISKKSLEYADFAADKFEDYVDAISGPLENIEKETTRVAQKTKEKTKEVAAKVNKDL